MFFNLKGKLKQKKIENKIFKDIKPKRELKDNIDKRENEFDLRYVIEMIRFPNYKRLEKEYMFGDNAISSFKMMLNEEKQKVKQALINRYDYKSTEADKMINEYYSNYK